MTPGFHLIQNPSYTKVCQLSALCKGKVGMKFSPPVEGKYTYIIMINVRQVFGENVSQHD